MDSTRPTEDTALAALREAHGDRYIIRQHGKLFVATDRNPDTTTEPTIMADSAEELAEAMQSPGERVGCFRELWGR